MYRNEIDRKRIFCEVELEQKQIILSFGVLWNSGDRKTNSHILSVFTLFSFSQISLYFSSAFPNRIIEYLAKVIIICSNQIQHMIGNYSIKKEGSWEGKKVVGRKQKAVGVGMREQRPAGRWYSLPKRSHLVEFSCVLLN